MTKKKQGIFLGAAILSLSGILVKVIGVFFRIPLTNLVGSAAMSYYSSAYSVYVLLLSVATSGLPTGISVMVSRFSALKNYRSVSATVRISFAFFTAMGFSLSVLGVLFSNKIATVLNSEDAVWSVAAIMPAVFFMSAVSVFRGYFQGMGDMTPTAVSNVVEAVGKLLFGYGFSFLLYRNGYPEEIIVGGAVLGVTVGTVLSSVYMTVAFFVRKNGKKSVSGFFMRSESKGKIFSSLISVTFPVTLSSVTSSLMGTIDSFLVMTGLRGYMNTDTAKLYWGAYANMSQTVFNLPSFIMVSVATSLIPVISSSFALSDKTSLFETVSKSFRITSAIAFGSAFFLFLSSSDVLTFLFSKDPVGVGVAAPLLEILSFALISVGLTNVTAAILNSADMSRFAVFSVAVGALLKTVLTYILVGIPEINISGAPIATNAVYPVILFINLFFIRKKLGYFLSLTKNFLFPSISAVTAFVAAKFSLSEIFVGLSCFENLIIGFLSFFVVYISLLFLFGVIDFCGILRNFTKMKKSP